MKNRKPALHPLWAKAIDALRESEVWAEAPAPPEKRNGRPPTGLKIADDHIGIALKWVVDKNSRGRVKSCHHRRDRKIGTMTIPTWRLALDVDVRQEIAIAAGRRLTERDAVYQALATILRRFRFESGTRHISNLHRYSPLIESALRALRRYRTQKKS